MMDKKRIFAKNGTLWLGTFLTIIEGILAGFSYCAIYFVIVWLQKDEFTVTHICKMMIGLLILFSARFLIYGLGYTKSQIGGALVSKNIRRILGDKLKRIPLRNFEKGHIGAYVNTMNSDVANYEKILTHNIGNIAKNVTLALTIIATMFSMYFPAGVVMLVVCMMLIPNLWLSFRVVKVYGKDKNKVEAQTVSEIVEYISGIQTLRIYGMCGKKNQAVTEIMRRYSEVCYQYEEKGIPVGFGYNMISWVSVPVVILLALEPFRQGQLSATNFIMTVFLPLFYNANHFCNRIKSVLLHGWFNSVDNLQGHCRIVEVCCSNRYCTCSCKNKFNCILCTGDSAHSNDRNINCLRYLIYHADRDRFHDRT